MIMHLMCEQVVPVCTSPSQPGLAVKGCWKCRGLSPLLWVISWQLPGKWLVYEIPHSATPSLFLLVSRPSLREAPSSNLLTCSHCSKQRAPGFVLTTPVSSGELRSQLHRDCRSGSSLLLHPSPLDLHSAFLYLVDPYYSRILYSWICLLTKIYL